MRERIAAALRSLADRLDPPTNMIKVSGGRVFVADREYEVTLANIVMDRPTYDQFVDPRASVRYPDMHAICARCYAALVGPLEDAWPAPDAAEHKERCCSCACVTYSGLYIRPGKD